MYACSGKLKRAAACASQYRPTRFAARTFSRISIFLSTAATPFSCLKVCGIMMRFCSPYGSLAFTSCKFQCTQNLMHGCASGNVQNARPRSHTQRLRTPYASKRMWHTYAGTPTQPSTTHTHTCPRTNLGFLVSDFHGRPVNQIRLEVHVFVYVIVRACKPVRITKAYVFDFVCVCVCLANEATAVGWLSVSKSSHLATDSEHVHIHRRDLHTTS